MIGEKNQIEQANSQREIYDRRYAAEAQLSTGVLPLEFLDLRLRRAWHLLPTNPTVLDLGCGSGRLLWRQRPRAPFLYVGIDVSRAGLVKAVERITGEYPQSSFAQGLGDHLPFDDASFDAVFSVSVVEHIPDARRFIHECARVLKVNGLLVIHTPNPKDILTVDGFLRRHFPGFYTRRSLAVGHTYELFVSPGLLSEMMSERGLRVIRLEYTDSIVEWVWINAIWPGVLRLARYLHTLAPQPGKEVNGLHHMRSAAVNRGVWLYNSLFFPILRLMCWPDRLVELTGHSGGYIAVARKGKS